MDRRDDNSIVDIQTAAAVLRNMAAILVKFHENDVALQNALSQLTRTAGPSGAMRELQHIDMLTQTHEDLARLLPVLADCVQDIPTSLEDLRNALVLRSLQDVLLDMHTNDTVHEAGELSLF